MKKPIRNSENGFAHVVLVIVFVVLVAAVGAAGWKLVSDKKSPSSNSGGSASTGSSTVGSTAAETACLAQYHDTDLCHFEAASLATPIDKTAYEATLTSTQSGATTVLTYEQDGKGNYSVMASGGASSTSFNSILLGGNVYIQSGSEWLEYPSGSTTPTQSSDPSSNLSFMGTLANVKFTKVGTDTCAGLPCLKYAITDSTDPSATQYAWFDTQQYKLREYSATDATSGTLDMKLSYQPVTITAPSPVQQFTTAE